MILQRIQSELKAPKGQYNDFGKYAYRSCEDIVEALKPILAKYKAVVILSDEMVEVGGRVYVKATATFKTENEVVSVSAYAREPVAMKGMNESQITGAASSYARKYALNGLFCIDDTKDADTMDNRQVATTKVQTNVSKAPVADKLIVSRVKKCKTQAELNALWHKIQAELGDSFQDVQQVYTVVFAQRKAEINGNN